MLTAPSNNTQQRLQQILREDHPLCREDIVWILDYIKKRVADKDSVITNLPQPRLIENFSSFAEIAMLMIHRRGVFDQEADRLRDFLREATHGLR